LKALLNKPRILAK